MNKSPILELSHMTALSQVLGNYMTGSEITKLLHQCRIIDNSGESTKWRRLEHAFIERQNQDQSSNAILLFVKEALQPVKFINNQSTYNNFLLDTNQVLMMIGIEVGKEGSLKYVPRAATIDEVKRRTEDLKRILIQRSVHNNVLKYCIDELLQENYFHAIFEAAKSLSDRVREMTGLSEDGSRLFDKAFSCKNPWLAINRLTTDTECNQQNGLKEMLHGITHLVRNVTAHEVKIKWIVEEKEAIDILQTISFLHKYLDQCFVVPRIHS